MSDRYTIEHLLAVAHGDRDLIDELYAHDILIAGAEITQGDVERARLAWCLVRELEVNLAGVDIILRMRDELVVSKRTLTLLAAQLKPDKDGP